MVDKIVSKPRKTSTARNPKTGKKENVEVNVKKKIGGKN